MAGIGNAEKCVKDKENYGQVLKFGVFEDEGQKFDFAILKRFNHDGEELGIGVEITYEGCDKQFEKGIKEGDFVCLHILDEYCAEWSIVVESDMSLPWKVNGEEK